eukprot:1928120-Prymnesium_polylepis.1
MGVGAGSQSPLTHLDGAASFFLPPIRPCVRPCVYTWPLFSALMAAVQTEPAAARRADRAALERYAFCRLLGEGD